MMSSVAILEAYNHFFDLISKSFDYFALLVIGGQYRALLSILYITLHFTMYN